MFEGMPPIISDEAIKAILNFLKVAGIPGVVGLAVLIMAWTGNWPWIRRRK